jgi:5-methylcytosine-specific restriction endonuclease McrA
MPKGIPNNGINGGRFKKGHSLNKGKAFPQRRSDGNSNWKGGKARCKDCGKPLSTYTGKRCIKCFIKNRVGENHPMYGVHRFGEKAPNWRGDKCITSINKRIRMSYEYRLWRETVFIKNDWTCQMCGIRGGNLEAHHIWSFTKYPELRFSINNGISLCVKCHKKIHTKKGKG